MASLGGASGHDTQAKSESINADSLNSNLYSSEEGMVMRK